jgi:hypothetical protein
MPFGKYRPNLDVARLGIDRMSQIVKDVDVVCDQDPISYLHQRARPDPRTLSEIAPRPDFDLSTMSKRQKLAADDTIGTNCNAIALTTHVANSRSSH